MRKVLRTFTLLLAAQCVAASTEPVDQDKPRWFQADMVVFIHEQSLTQRGADGSEKWPAIQSHPLPANAIKLKPASSLPLGDQSAVDVNDWLSDQKPAPSDIDLQRDAFIDLPYPSQLLQKEANALARQPGYRILQSKAWLMPVREGESTRPVAIEGFNLSPDSNSLLEGTITVSSSRFMHVAVNLWFSDLVQEGLSGMLQNVVSDQGVAVNGEPHKPVVGRDIQMVRLPDGQPMRIARNFHLKESRRIRDTDEIQYLDSPVIGVLFKLTPYERPEQPLLPEVDPDASKSNELGILPGIIQPKNT